MIVIFALALIVVGPEKLPGLARSLAKGLMEMKSAVNQLKESLNEDGDALHDVQNELKQTAQDLQTKMIEADTEEWVPAKGPHSQQEQGAASEEDLAADKQPAPDSEDESAFAHELVTPEQGDEQHPPSDPQPSKETSRD